MSGSASSARLSGLATGEREEQRLVQVEVEQHVQAVAVVVAEERAQFVHGRFTSPISTLEPSRRWMYEHSSRSQSSASACASPSKPIVSTRNGAASTRNPSTPSCSQQLAIFRISSRTSGLPTLRSGWNE